MGLNTTLTPELIEEGVVREFIHTINKMRKKSGMSITDEIDIYVCKKDKPLVKAVGAYKDYVMQETLAVGLRLTDNQTYIKIKND